MLFDNPHAMMPMAANKIADWLAPLLPITLLKRPYNGVNVHVASKYLGEWGKMRVSWRYKISTYDVPTQLASLDLLKSEEMEGSTVGEKINKRRISGCYERNVLVGTKVTEKIKLETCIYQLFKDKQLIA